MVPPDSLEQPLTPGQIGTITFASRFKRHERWWAALFFGLVVVLAFPQVVFLGRSLVPTDNYNPLEYTFNAANYGPGFVPEKEWTSRGLVLYANSHDPGGDWWQGEPALEFFRKAIYSGQFPFWDPTAACGAPAYNNLQSQFLFPPQMVLSLLGSTSTQKNIYILLLFWAGGFVTYCLLRRHELSQLASAAGGLVFLFSGALQQLGPSLFLGQVVACIPLLLLVTRWFLDFPTWRRAMGLAGTYAVVSLASFPPILCAGFGCTVFYFLFALILEKFESRLILLGRFAVAVVLSLGLVAVYYIPAFITIAHTPYVTQWYRGAALDRLAPRSLFDLLSPTATGGALVYEAPIMPPDIGHLYYVGVVGLLLAGLAFGRLQGRSRTLLVSSALLAALALLKIFGVPPIQWIASLPGSQSIHYHLYFGILVAFLFSLLAGLGFERLLVGRPVIQSVASLLVFGVGTRTLWVLARDSGALKPHAAWRWIADYRLLILFAVIFALLAATILLRSYLTRSARVAGFLLLALIFSEGVVNATYPHQRRWGIFEHPPKYVRAAQKLPRPARLFIGAALTANLGSAFGIETLDSLYMFSPPLMYDVYYKYAQPAAAISMREATTLPSEQLLDRAGITHILVRKALPILVQAAKLRGYSLRYEDAYVSLFSRDKATPRYFFTSEFEVTDRNSVLNQINSAPSSRVLLEATPAIAASPNRADDPQPEVISARLNSLTLRIRSPRPGLLYLADAFYDGWTASLNGRPVSILPANYAFRAVEISAGDVRLTLSYLPRGFITGAIVSVISVGVAISLALRRPGLGRKMLAPG